MSLIRPLVALFCITVALFLIASGVASAQTAPSSASDSPAAGRGFANPNSGAPKAPWGARPDGGAVSPAAQRPAVSWWRTILEMQRKFFRQMGGALKDFKNTGTLAASWALIIISFLYGIFHAAGPGHGKAVISSYILANGATVRRGIALSFLAATVQALSAIAIVSALAIALNATGIEIRLVAQRFELASSALITLAGVMLLTTYLWRRFKVSEPVLAHAHAGHAHSHQAHDHHHHDENCGCGHAHMPDPRDLEKEWSLSKAAAIVLAVGIRPCSGAIFVLIFALTQGLYWAGMLSTFAMSMGTAITVSVLAAGAVMFRGLTLRFASSRWTAGLYDIVAIAGSCLVIFFGVGLFLASLGPAKPF